LHDAENKRKRPVSESYSPNPSSSGGVTKKKKGVSHDAHLDADGKSFLRSPYVVMYRFNWTPRASLRSRMSHLLRKRMSCTYTLFLVRQSHKHGIAGAQTKNRLGRMRKAVSKYLDEEL
jgi:hypothetical protein